MDLPIGAMVVCEDGTAGRLKFVVVDPETDSVTDLVVERGLLRKHDVVVPVEWVARSDGQQVVLNAKLDDLERLPEYREVEFVRPDPSYRPHDGHKVEAIRFWANPFMAIEDGRPWFIDRVRLGIDDEQSVLVWRGMPVLAVDGSELGRVSHLVLDEKTHTISHLVVRRGALLHREYRIVETGQVASITGLGIRLKIDSAAFADLPQYRPVADDADVKARVEKALARDPQTAGAPLEIEVNDGLVRLRGTVPEATVRAARRIARRVRGVLGVIDETTRLAQPPLKIGAPVHARDGQCGTLHKVVVDPHARRVTHLIVGTGVLLTKDRVVPLEDVDQVDEDGIHLRLSTADVEQLPEYREDVFVEPGPGWQPLDEHETADALFWSGPYPGVAPPIMPVIEHVSYEGVPNGAITVRRGADVLFNDAPVGTLDHLLIDPKTGQLTHLVVEELRTGRFVIVAQDAVSEMHENAIVLKRWNPYEQGIPSYQSQGSGVEPATAVQGDFNGGNVASTGSKADAEHPLSPDSALMERITAALANDKTTGRIPIEVIVDRGLVMLKGVVPNTDVKERAERIVRPIPGVVTVMNELEMHSPEPDDVVAVPVGRVVEH